LFYCNKLKNFTPPISKSIPLTRIFEREIQRIEKIVAKLDADLQYDYGNEIEIIRNE
jgi:PHP family Zn ribbon phosphoesterase